MNHKVVRLLLFVIISSTSVLAQDKAPVERLLVARAQYYTPTTNGLRSFRCEATIDWKAMLTRAASGAEIPDDSPMLKYLQTVHLSVVDELKGKGSMEWSDTGALPEGKEEAAKHVRHGWQQIVEGFFQSWNAYMNGNMVPIPDKSVVLTSAGTGIHLQATAVSMKFDEDFDQNMLLTRVVVETPALKIVAIPTYVRTDDGLLISTVVSQVNQPPSAAPMEVTFRVEYAKVDSFQIPSRVFYDVKNLGAFEVGFNTCQVSVAASPHEPPVGNSSNRPIN